MVTAGIDNPQRIKGGYYRHNFSKSYNTYYLR